MPGREKAAGRRRAQRRDPELESDGAERPAGAARSDTAGRPDTAPSGAPDPDRTTLDALSESIRAIGLRDDLDELLDEVLDRARDLIGFEHCALMLYDRDRERLTVERARGYGDRLPEVLRLSLPRGAGLSGWAVDHRQPVRVADVSADPRYVAGLPEARSNLVVPLIVENDVAGVLNVESDRPNAFTREHEELLTVLGAQAALAILAQRSRHHLRQRIDQLEALYRISQLAADGDELDGTLAAMLGVAQEVIPEGQCAILLLDLNTGILRVKASQGYAEGVESLEIPLGTGITGRCAATGRVIRVDDVREEGDYIRGVAGARSEIAVPLIVENRVIGVLNAESPEPGAFTDAHQQTLSVIARQAAVVIRSAQLQDETRRLAITDPLTGLHNRRHFSQQLEDALRRAGRYGDPLSLVLLDVDHFKSINDRHGHHVGDRALELAADAMRRSLRDTDLIARIGGEEFAVLLFRANRGLALDIAERLRKGIACIRVPEGTEDGQGMTASVGVAFFAEDGHDSKALMRAADMALYAAKRAGRNRVSTVPGSEKTQEER